MEPLNDKEVTRHYIRFSFTLAGTALIAVFFFFTFLRTLQTEMKRIEIKTGEYDHIYTYQTEIVEKVDSLYSYMTLLNSSDRINDIAVQGIISNRKMNLLEHLNRMDERDSRVYHRLVGQVNTFLSLKDSIRRLSVQEELLRNDLLRCVQDNRQTNRRLALEGGK